MLGQQKPDVIGMQEALWRQIRDLEEALPVFDWIGLGRDGGSRGEFMAVLFRKDRLEPLAFDHFWLSDAPNEIGSTSWGNTNRRMVTWVLFRDRKTDRRFYFWNTHFDHQVQQARERRHQPTIHSLEFRSAHPSNSKLHDCNHRDQSDQPSHLTMKLQDETHVFLGAPRWHATHFS